MLDYSYSYSYQFAQVEKLSEFYKDSSKLQETIKIRAIVDGIRNSFKVPQSKVKLSVAQGARIYKFDISNPKQIKDQIIAAIYYLPELNRVDLYDYMISPDIPLIQWRNKKVVFKNYSMLADMAGYDKLFQPIVFSS